MSTQEIPGARGRAPGNRTGDWRAQALGLAGEGACQLDLQGRFVAVDDGLLAAAGYDAEVLLGEHVSTVLDDESARRTERALRALRAGDADGALARTVTVRTADGEQFRSEFRLDRRLDGDGRVEGAVGVLLAPGGQGRPGGDGPAVAAREVFARVTDAVYAVDEQWQFTYLDERAERLLGVDADDVVGRSIWSACPALEEGPLRERYREAMAEEEPAHFEWYDDADDRWFEVHAYPSETGLSVWVREPTDGKGRELRESERRLRQVVDLVPEYVYVKDHEGRFLLANEASAAAYRTTPADLEGKTLQAAGGRRENHEAWQEQNRSVIESGESKRVVGEPMTDAEGREHLLDTAPIPFELPGADERAVLGVSIDVTDRIERKRELERYETIVETVEDGIYAVDGDNRFTMVNDAFVAMSGYDREQLVGAHATVVFDEAAVRACDRIQGDENRPASVEEELYPDEGDPLPVESRFAPLDHDRNAGRAGVVRDVSERKSRERELEAQRERLATLNEFNGVVQEISHAIVDADTRDAIERLICEQLAATDQFAFAWFGDVAPDGEVVRARTAAGADEYLDGIHVPLGEDAPVGPIVRAIRTSETQTANDVLSDPETAPWRDHARRHGYRSFAAIPVSYEGIFYGVLNVYGEEPGVFDEETRCIVSRLGSVVGHAINALDRKNALVGNDVTEVEFRVSDVFEARGVDCGDGGVTFDSILPTGDGTYVAYGSASEEGIETLRTLRAALDHYTDLAVREQRRGDTRFVLRMREPPVTSLTAAVGGRVAGAKVEDGTMRTTVQLPYDADVREFVDRIREAYPGVEVLAQRRRTRPKARVEPFETVLDDQLTDRQRVTLEAAYVAGFFEWPRESTGEEVAESLDISPATFHEHLRAAERRVVAALFGAPTG